MRKKMNKVQSNMTNKSLRWKCCLIITIIKSVIRLTEAQEKKYSHTKQTFRRLATVKIYPILCNKEYTSIDVECVSVHKQKCGKIKYTCELASSFSFALLQLYFKSKQQVLRASWERRAMGYWVNIHGVCVGRSVITMIWQFVHNVCNNQIGSTNFPHSSVDRSHGLIHRTYWMQTKLNEKYSLFFNFRNVLRMT